MSEPLSSQNFLSDEALTHYQAGREAQRLFKGTGQLEFTRTKELLSRYLPPPPAVIFDIGGGSGVYGFWLAQQGYEVHLIDAVHEHIEQARSTSHSSDYPLASIVVGDARQLNRDDSSVDVVLLLGPLYHLIERSDTTKWLPRASHNRITRGLSCLKKRRSNFCRWNFPLCFDFGWIV
jgi:2-polyprenyl-3-methyl-5-hydroxy-6-metoxy-1,4-benzoquinol methylase